MNWLEGGEGDDNGNFILLDRKNAERSNVVLCACYLVVCSSDHKRIQRYGDSQESKKFVGV